MGTYGSVRGESLRKKEEMKMKNAESLEAVHTHTHTNSYSRVEFVYSTEQENKKNLFAF